MTASEYAPTSEDNVRVVVAALGGEIKHYPIRGAVDWDEVVRLYGERFRGGRLLHYEGVSEYDDEGYYQSGEAWVLAAADVDNPGRVIAECLLQEVREASTTKDAHINALSWSGVSLGEYADLCNDTLLFQRGIVFAYKADVVEGESMGDIWSYIEGDDERRELEEFLEW
jgi:hypothetical protein